MLKNSTLIFLILLFTFACKHNHDQHKGHHHGENDSMMNNHDHAHNHQHNHANQHMHNTPVEDLIKRFESKEREKTQKPNEVIALFGDIKGKKILDIGSGSGYFTFRMADKGAYVIAGDVDDKFHDHIKSKMLDNELYAENIEIRKLPYDSPFLHSGEVDHAIIVNTYHHIDNRSDYFRELKSGLKNEGILMVVDFKKEEFEEEIQGPPYEMRISKDTVISELKTAGFINFTTNIDLLPYQYIILAKKSSE